MKFTIILLALSYLHATDADLNNNAHERRLPIFPSRTRHNNHTVADKVEENKAASEGDFTYVDPNTEWPQEFESCGGRRQSPIDLNPYEFGDAKLPPLEFHHHDNLPLGIKLINIGHSVQLRGEWLGRNAPVISGGPLEHTYQFSQLHFHWGHSDEKGSEHTIMEESLPLELHAVYWNRAYKNQSEAMKHHDGLAVLGYLISIDQYYHRNVGIENIVAGFPTITKPGQETELEPFPLAAFELDMIASEYITYLGSLTTPPCSEVVTWLIAGNNLRGVSKRELKSFRRLQLDNHDHQNFRPTQPLNGRKVYWVQSNYK